MVQLEPQKTVREARLLELLERQGARGVCEPFELQTLREQPRVHAVGRVQPGEDVILAQPHEWRDLQTARCIERRRERRFAHEARAHVQELEHILEALGWNVVQLERPWRRLRVRVVIVLAAAPRG